MSAAPTGEFRHIRVEPITGTIGAEIHGVDLRGRLAPHKVPRVVELRNDLPRSPAGKVLRQQVRT